MNPLFTDDLELPEQITISRQFKEDVVRPILKVRGFEGEVLLMI